MFNRPGEPVLNNNNEIIEGMNNDSQLHPEVYNIMLGGVHLIYSFGDSHQLSPVNMKPLYSKLSAIHGSTDTNGRIAFQEFYNPPDNESWSTVIMMDNDVCQDQDTQAMLLRFFNTRTGTATK